jgi:putative phosphoribosyl transferase
MLFKDREDAAKQLVRRLEKEWLDKEYNAKDKQQQQKSNNNNNIIILAIPRGGVVIGDVISNILDAKLDIIVSRKIGAPSNLELAIGAVMPDGSYFLNKDIVNMLNVPQSYIIEQANIQKKEIERNCNEANIKNAKWCSKRYMEWALLEWIMVVIFRLQ